MTEPITVNVVRTPCQQASSGRVSCYTVPYFDRMDVVDVLKWIRDHLDPTLAFRHSCEEGKCGLCGIELNGRAVLACKRVVRPGETLSIGPLPGYAVVKDLIVDRSDFDRDVAAHRASLGVSEEPRTGGDEGDLETYIAISNCVECGVCTTTCPAQSAGVHPAAGPVGFLESVHAGIQGDGALNLSEIGSDLFRCLECGQCEEVCSRDVPVPHLVAQARSAIRGAGAWPAGPQSVIARLEQGETLLAGSRRRGTAGWLEQASPEVLACAEKRSARFAVFVGCQFGQRKRLQATPHRLVELLLAAGVDVAVLGEDEQCCGHPCDAVGGHSRILESAEQHIDAFACLDVETIIVGCPGCYRAWSYEFPRELGKPTGFDVVHASVFLQQLLADGKLELAHPFPHAVVYHDPCELGRMGRILDEPRAVLDRIPMIERRVLLREREMGACCGGGGLVPSTGGSFPAEVTARRIEDLVQTHADTIVTACPNCEFTLTSGLRAAGSERGIEVLDIVDVVYRSVFGEEES